MRQDATITKHGEALAGLRVWTAIAAAVGSALGGIVVALVLKFVLGN